MHLFYEKYYHLSFNKRTINNNFSKINTYKKPNSKIFRRKKLFSISLVKRFFYEFLEVFSEINIQYKS